MSLAVDPEIFRFEHTISCLFSQSQSLCYTHPMLVYVCCHSRGAGPLHQLRSPGDATDGGRRDLPEADARDRARGLCRALPRRDGVPVRQLRLHVRRGPQYVRHEQVHRRQCVRTRLPAERTQQPLREDRYERIGEVVGLIYP